MAEMIQDTDAENDARLHHGAAQVTRDAWRFARLLSHAVPGSLARSVLWTLVEVTASVAIPFVTRKLFDALAASRLTHELRPVLVLLGIEFTAVILRAIAQR